MSKGEESFDYGVYFRETPPAAGTAKQDLYKPRIYELKELKRIGKVDRPSMNNEKRKMIEQKLEVDKKAEVLALTRVHKDNMMVRYKNNPFLDLHSDRPKKVQDEGQYRAAIAELDSLNQERVMQCQERLQNYRNYGNVIDAVHGLKDREMVLGKKEGQDHYQLENLSRRWGAEIRQAQKVVPVAKEQPSEPPVKPDPTFEEILEMEDENYYSANQGDINLFQYMKGTHQPFLTNKVLDQHFFSHLSVVDKLAAFKIFFPRELGRQGRQLQSDSAYRFPGRIDFITSKEIAFNMEKVTFEDLLSVASGRFSPDIVYKATNDIQIKQTMQTKSELPWEAINYRDETQNRKAVFDDVDFEQYEIKDYLKMTNNAEEKKYLKKCEGIIEAIGQEAREKTRLTTQTIKDKALHQQISSSIDQRLDFMVGMDTWKVQTEKKIRSNKVVKNRNEKIKIRAMIDGLVLKNNEEAKLKLLLEGKPK